MVGRPRTFLTGSRNSGLNPVGLYLVHQKRKKRFARHSLLLLAGFFVRLFLCLPASGCLSRDIVRDTGGNDDHHDSKDDQGIRQGGSGGLLCPGSFVVAAVLPGSLASAAL